MMHKIPQYTSNLKEKHIKRYPPFHHSAVFHAPGTSDAYRRAFV